MPRGMGYKGKKSKGRGRRKGGAGRSPVRKTMRPSRRSGKKLYYVGGYQA